VLPLLAILRGWGAAAWVPSAHTKSTKSLRRFVSGMEVVVVSGSTYLGWLVGKKGISHNGLGWLK